MSMKDKTIPVIVIDDTAVKRRGICEFVDEAPLLRLVGQASNEAEARLLLETLCQRESGNPALAGWLVLSDLRLGQTNGVDLGRTLLDLVPGLRVVIYTQEPSWTLATEVLRREYSRRGTPRRSTTEQPGLHGYALFSNMEPGYLEQIATTVVIQHSTFIDNEVLNHLLRQLRGNRLTPRQEECAVLVAQGLSNDEIALRMGFLNAQGQPNMGPLENLVSELYAFFAIEGLPSDPGRRVLLAHAYEAYAGQRPV
jgi:DNA-binding NarL/FixJ family response regulator